MRIDPAAERLVAALRRDELGPVDLRRLRSRDDRGVGREPEADVDSFVMQSGVPLVSVKLACAKATGPSSSRRNALQAARSSRNRSASHVDAADLRAVERRQGHGRDCAVVTGEIGELPLSATSCPTGCCQTTASSATTARFPKASCSASSSHMRSR